MASDNPALASLKNEQRAQRADARDKGPDGELHDALEQAFPASDPVSMQTSVTAGAAEDQAGEPSGVFAMRCRENGIEYRFTKINHPWTNEQVERMNRTIKDATVKRYHYEATTSSINTSRTSSQPTISAGARRPSKASRPTSSPASAGLQSRNDSPSIHSTKCRD